MHNLQSVNWQIHPPLQPTPNILRFHYQIVSSRRTDARINPKGNFQRWGKYACLSQVRVFFANMRLLDLIDTFICCADILINSGKRTLSKEIKGIIFASSNYKVSLMQRSSGIRRDIHSRGSRHDDGESGSRDSRRGGSHHRHIHIHHHIRERLQERWLLPPRQTLQVRKVG